MKPTSFVRAEDAVKKRQMRRERCQAEMNTVVHATILEVLQTLLETADLQ